MSIEMESAKRLSALKSKADGVTGETSDTLADAVDTLIAGFGHGGGTKIASGSFTMTTNSDKTPELVHNFGTKKIFLIIYRPNDETLVINEGYRAIIITFANLPAILGFESYDVNFTGYNPNHTGVVTVPLSSLKASALIRSPWQSQTNINESSTVCGVIGDSTITDNSIIYDGRMYPTFKTGETYNYIIVGV